MEEKLLSEILEKLNIKLNEIQCKIKRDKKDDIKDNDNVEKNKRRKI